MLPKMAIGKSNALANAKHIMLVSREMKVLAVGSSKCTPSKWIVMAGKTGLPVPRVLKHKSSPVADVVVGYLT